MSSGKDKWFKKVINTLTKQKADVMLIGGDIINYSYGKKIILEIYLRN